jgi:hypothetical protein
LEKSPTLGFVSTYLIVAVVGFISVYFCSLAGFENSNGGAVLEKRPAVGLTSAYLGGFEKSEGVELENRPFEDLASAIFCSFGGFENNDAGDVVGKSPAGGLLSAYFGSLRELEKRGTGVMILEKRGAGLLLEKRGAEVLLEKRGAEVLLEKRGAGVLLEKSGAGVLLEKIPTVDLVSAYLDGFENKGFTFAFENRGAIGLFSTYFCSLGVFEKKATGGVEKSPPLGLVSA